MRYLYFDIESIDIEHKTICTFGYVLADEKFNIIDKDDILINPGITNKKKYDWRVVKNMLAYPLAEIENSMNFKEQYQRIKNLLTNPQHVVLGFAVINDLKYVNGECKRNGCNEFDIKCYDVQDFYKQYKGEDHIIGLKKMVDLLGIDYTSFREHLSQDDAEMTMLCAKKICEEMDITIEQMLELCSQSFIEKKTITEFVPTINEKTFKRNVKLLQKQYENCVFNKSICFSDTFEYNEDLFDLVKRLFEKGYDITNQVSASDYFIAGETEGKRDASFKFNIEQGINIKKLSMQELKQMLDDSERQEIEIPPSMLQALKEKGMTYEEYLQSIEKRP